MGTDRKELDLEGFLQSQYGSVDQNVLNKTEDFVPKSLTETVTYGQQVALISLVYYYIYNDTLGSVAYLLANLFDMIAQGDRKVSLKLLQFAHDGTTVDMRAFRLRKNEQQLFERSYANG